MGEPLQKYSCREPTANRGHMVKPLCEYFGSVMASDVHDYGCGFAQFDYLFPAPLEDTDWTIFNPPFRLAEEFITRAMLQSRVGVAALVRCAFLEGVGRYERLYQPAPPTAILQFTERVVMHKGRLAPKGSTATAYAWLVWKLGQPGTAFGWLPPCRRRLEKPSDYS